MTYIKIKYTRKLIHALETSLLEENLDILSLIFINGNKKMFVK
jgi:hypothetical protein